MISISSLYFIILVPCADLGYWVQQHVGRTWLLYDYYVVVARYYMHLCLMSCSTSATRATELSRCRPNIQFCLPNGRTPETYVITPGLSRYQSTSIASFLQSSIARHEFAMETLQCTNVFIYTRTKTCQPIMILFHLLTESASRHDTDPCVVQ